MSSVSESGLVVMQATTRNSSDMVFRVNEREGEGTSSDSKTLLAKILAIILLLLVTSLCGFIPFALDRCFKWTTTNSKSPGSATTVKCLLYFGGGVLFATTFLHLLPEVQEVCEDLLSCKMIPELPFDLSTVLMCCGFFLMYFIEEILHTYMHHRQNNILKKNKAGAAFERGRSVRRSILYNEHGKVSSPNDRINSVVSESSLDSTKAIVEVDDECCHKDCENTICHTDDIRHCAIIEVPARKAFENEHPNEHDHHHHHHQHEYHDGKEGSHNHMPTISNDDNLASSLRGLGLVLALSLHELFEGLAIGLESSSSSVWFTCAAVAAHKLVLAFCVGMELVVARTRKTLAIIYIITFSIVSPIGIAIGILVSMHSNGSAPSLASAILQGIACGTLLYVVFFEILTKNHAGWWAYLTLLLGFAIMFILQIFGNEADHHHGSEHSCGT